MATAANQQFSLKWNNYSHHIVTALEELRVEDELTDVTLSSDGQRIKAHKVMLSACSVFFKETFKENPCKHPVVILKGVSFQDLQAVVQFMYNGQVNVTQERLTSFLQTAEILQIRGLTDSASSDKEEATIPAPAKKRPQTFPQASAQHVDSINQDADRPPTPKRKRIIGNASGTFAPAQNPELPGTASVISASGAGASASNTNNGHLHNNTQPSQPPALHALNSDNSGDGLPPVKYEDQDQEDIDEEFDRNDDSLHDKDKDVIERESDLSNSLGSGKIRASANGTGERRPRYNLQPSSNDLLSATGVVDATNGTLSQRLNGVSSSSSRDLIFDGKQGSYVHMNGMAAANGNGHAMTGYSKLRNRLSSRSLSSGGAPPNNHQQPAQQDDRVIKYAPLQSHIGRHSHSQGHDSLSNSSQEDIATFPEDGSDSPQGTDDEVEQHQRNNNHQYQGPQQPQRRPSLSQQVMQLQQQKGRTIPHHPMKTIHSSQQQAFMVRNSVVNGHIKGLNNIRTAGNSTPTSPEDLSLSSPARHQPDLSTPNFSLTQQLLQQNVLSLISNNPAEGIKTDGGSTRVATIPALPSSSSSSSFLAVSATNGSISNGIGMEGVNGEQPIIAPYVCDVCGKRYVHHRSLNDHKKSHTGATKCPICLKSFSKVANMRAHYTAQHGSGSGLSNDSNSSNGSGGADHNGESGNNLNDDNQLGGHIPINSSA